MSLAPAQSSWIEDGQQVQSLDLDSIGTSASVMAGEAVTSIIGVADANTDMSPLTAVPGPGMSVLVGGPGETVLVMGRLADYIPVTSVPIAAASGSTRYDLIAFQYADVIVPTGASANFMDSMGNIAPAPTAFVYRGINMTTVTGTPGGGLPAAPSGFDPLAQVEVDPGATSLAPDDITLLLPTIASLLRGLVGGGVSSVNSKTGAIVIDAGPGIVIDNTGTDIKVDNAGVISLNGQTGAQSIVADTGNVTITPHGSSVGIAVVASGGGATGITTISSSDGSIIVQDEGSTVNLTLPPAKNVIWGGFGTVPLDNPGGTAISPPIVLPPGRWAIMCEVLGFQMSNGSIRVSVPGYSASDTTVSGSGTLYNFAWANNVVLTVDTTFTSEMVWTNDAPGISNATVKILAYPY